MIIFKRSLFHMSLSKAFLILLYFGVIVEMVEGSILRKFHNFGCLKGNIEIENGNLVFIENSANDDESYTHLLSASGEDFETFSEMNLDLNIKSKTVMEYSKHDLQKSVSMLINQLADFNNIKVTFSLVAEHGPPHQKIFTIQLKLGNEEYEGIGNSLKQAKRIASAKALKNTKYEHPPVKNVETQLYDLARKRNEEVEFINEYGQLIASSKDLQNPTLFPTHNVQKLKTIRSSEDHNNTEHENTNEIKNTTGDYLRYVQLPDEPSMVRLKVGNREYVGTGYTIDAARHDAAIKAIQELKWINNNENSVDNSVNENTQTKSAMSLIYETAVKLDKQIVFSIIKEEGPPHARLFTSRCQVDELVAEAEGFSKKNAKKAAAEQMLEKFQKLGWLELISSNKVTKGKRNKKRNAINKDNVQVSEEIPAIIYEKEPTLISETEKFKSAMKRKYKKNIKDTLIELAKKLGVSVQYWDIPKNNHQKYMTFVSLDLEPAQVCFGMDAVLETSREIASLKAFEELGHLGVDNTYTNSIKRTRKPNYMQHMAGDKKQFDYSYETKMR